MEREGDWHFERRACCLRGHPFEEDVIGRIRLRAQIADLFARAIEVSAAVLMRCTVATFFSGPSPLLFTTSSFSHGMFSAVAPGERPTTFPTISLPSNFPKSDRHNGRGPSCRR